MRALQYKSFFVNTVKPASHDVQQFTLTKQATSEDL